MIPMQAGMGVAAANPYAAAIMAGASVVDGFMNQPGAPKSANSGTGMFDQHFDGSGWVVATGGSEARALPTVTSAVQQTAANAMSLLNNPMVLIAGVVVALAFFRRGQ
ncbi:MAG: hypothetical protein HOQ37_16355 [Cupriavidus sp.]|nr:hypothetical protein [Cupriavidus sp.]